MIEWWNHVKKEFLTIKESITEEVRNKLQADSLQSKNPEDWGILTVHAFTESFRKNDPDWKKIPSVFKKINSEKIILPKNFPPRQLTVAEAIVRRISRRNSKKPLNLEEISELLYFTNGFKCFVDRDKYGLACKTMTPSGGSCHPLELYLILNNVSGVKEGVYHFDTENHALEIVSQEKMKKTKIFKLINKQQSLVDANFLFITAIHKRTTWKYGPRGYRLIHIEAGHLGQNVYLIGEAMGLSVCAIGGWNRQLAKEILNIDEKEEITVYVLAIGKE